MSPDRLVTARHVLKSAMELERRTSKRVLAEWERLEPDLAEYVMESLTSLYHGLVDVGLSRQESRKLFRQAETLVLVSLMALRQAQREQWSGQEPETPPAPLEPG